MLTKILSMKHKRKELTFLLGRCKMKELLIMMLACLLVGKMPYAPTWLSSQNEYASAHWFVKIANILNVMIIVAVT